MNSINRAQLAYWRTRGYSAKNINEVGLKLDKEAMIARVVFAENGNIELTISNRTFDRDEGHPVTIMKFFGDVAAHEACRGKSGAILIFLDDGMWEYFSPHSMHAPILAFGKHVQDHCTFVMPDPGFLGSFGYSEDLEEVRQLEEQVGWSKKIPTVFWRGAATGLGIEGRDWDKTARGRLTLFAKELDKPRILDAKITKMAQLSEEQRQTITDAGVTGEPCDFLDFLGYKFLIDADGYCCAWRSLFLKLATESLVLKMNSDFEQWYFRDLIPWVHYIPLAKDLTGFLELYEWLKNEDDDALQRIVMQAHALIKPLTYGNAVTEVAELCAAILECAREE